MQPVPIDIVKLKTLRESRGWTMQQAAEAANLSGGRQSWNDVESGRRPNPTVDTALRIARALGVKIDDLVTDKTA